MDDDRLEIGNAAMAHANEVRLGSTVKACLGIAAIYAAGRYGTDAQVCADQVNRCSATPFWNAALFVTGGFVLLYSMANLMHALTLSKSWSKLAVNAGNFAGPMVVLTLAALGVLTATADGL